MAPFQKTHVASFQGPHPKRVLRPSMLPLLHRNLCAAGAGKGPQICAGPSLPFLSAWKVLCARNDLIYEPCS